MNFDDAALEWDTQSRIQRAKILSQKIADESGNNSDFCGLDFGCGTGLLSLNLSDSFKEIFCCDLSLKMLEVVNEKIELSKVDNIHTVTINELYSSKFDNKFDVIFSSMVFHHIVDTEEEIRRLCKLLKENGTFIIIDLDTVDRLFHSNDADFDGYHGFQRQHIIDILVRCGLKNISINTVFSGQKCIDNDSIDYSLFLIKGTK